jgi:hypothetical protein
VTKRDRIVVFVILSVGVFAALWFVALGPKRGESAKLDGKIALQQKRLADAQAGTNAARDAKSRYEGDYAAVARLGQAVPADEDTASLIYELDHAASRTDIDFRSLELSTAATTPASAAPAPAATVPAADGSTTGATGATGAAGAAAPQVPAVSLADFPTMPFTFELEGSFFHLEAFLRKVAKFTSVQGKQISVAGRLVSVTGIQIAASAKGFPRIGATVKATAYLLPASEGLMNGATAAAPALASSTTTPGAASPAAPTTPATAALTTTGGGK